MITRRKPHILFCYWGRRGLSQFVFELGQAALAEPRIEASISVSKQNEIFSDFQQFGNALFPVETFANGHGAFTAAHRIPILRRSLSAKIRSEGISAVVELMPHVWSSLVLPASKSAGARYVTVVHDADPHPGDRTQWAKPLSDRAASKADAVIGLSASVTTKIAAAGRISPAKIHTLFHPDLGFTRPRERKPPGDRAWKLLFLGRIMSYKGLPLCIETVKRLRSRGHKVELGVFGEGHLGESASELNRLGAEVVNRWLSAAEIEQALQRYDAVILSYTEASQSGVAAAALGAGVPIIATPVGGLREQVVDGFTGVVSKRIDVESLAEAIEEVFQPVTYSQICGRIIAARENRSMGAFLDAVLTVALPR